ncbi:hypothetical protein WOLCODRAFT_160244 [Wolfiporia cocos MD-104 SS10]|uniref:GRAM domain-containing protein n=1 Tax=Wolfiporia cocos (strain MD-104) TaxID=742152 RepID=A0A2H3J4I7_WOLCO|nr:hypothetical protein WOLCODRAFT_160244 [Wolfiporia cocos MD-104 SS10]
MSLSSPNAHPGGRERSPFLPPPTHPALRGTHSAPPEHLARRAAASDAPNLPTRSPGKPSVQSTQSDTSHHLEPISDTELDAAPGAFTNQPQVLPDAEDQLSEVQLRELYDEEEIERFMHLFSAYVREARVADAAVNSAPNAAQGPVLTETLVHADTEDDEAEESGEWVSLDDRPGDPTPPPLPPRPVSYSCISERIALEYIVPILPPAPPAQPAFTLKRLQLTVQRLLVATVPVYWPFLKKLALLATWQEWNTSLVYCAAYWILWYHNLLLPALLLRILYSLIRRKLLPYPNLQELQEHRRQIEQAKDFSAVVVKTLVTSPTYDAQDIWQLVRDYNRARRVRKANNGSKNGQDTENSTDTTSKSCEGDKEVDIKRVVLALLNHVADLHERVKNIFLWRRPNMSLLYGSVLVAMFCMTLLPARYLAKLTGFAVGVVFWHIAPILVAIPASERARLPKPFAQVPTDADYAMELISQRVARGLEIKPRRRKAATRHDSDDSSTTSEGHESSIASIGSALSNTSVDWKKWGDRVATTQTVTREVKQRLQGGQWKRLDTWRSLNPLTPQIAMPHGTTEPRMETFTFPAQYAKTSGLITLTSDTLFFTTLLSTTAKLSIPLKDMLGVKKTGPMRGINVRWLYAGPDGETEEREEKFLWVGARNELFARLVAWGGRRWANV